MALPSEIVPTGENLLSEIVLRGKNEQNLILIIILFVFIDMMMTMMMIITIRIVHTADALRLLVVARYGGFYSDTDVVFLRFCHDDDDDDDDDVDDDDSMIPSTQ